MKLVGKGDVLVGRYRLDASLGSGGMGAVWRAFDLRLMRDVALKALHPRHRERPEALERFQREARVVSKLDHPNIVQVFDVGDHEGCMFLVMPLLEGRSLRDALGSAPLSLDIPRALELGVDMLSALEHAHSRGIVHRDVKPENIFLRGVDGAKEEAVLVDFGIAFSLRREEDARQTRDGVLVGTPSYCSPEQASTHTVGSPSDLYSFGTMLFEMLSGNPLFSGEPNVVLSKHIFLEAPTLKERRPEVPWPTSLEALVRKLLLKDPAARPTASASLRELSALSREWRERFAHTRRDPSRRQRMVPAGLPDRSESPAPRRLHAVGLLDGNDELRLALSMAEIAVVEQLGEAQVIVALQANLDALEPWIRAGKWVIAGTNPAEPDHLVTLLKAGVHDVVSRQQSPRDTHAAVVRQAKQALTRLARGEAIGVPPS